MSTATITRDLLTIDEARARISTSALDLVRHCHARHPATVTAMLWGSGDLPGLDRHDTHVAEQHRHVLDDIVALGYLAEAHQQLDGIASAVGLPDGRITPLPF